MASLHQILTEQLSLRGTGHVYTPKDFLELGSYEAVRKAFQRLEKEGRLRRLLRGVYEVPRMSLLLQGPAAPDPDEMARAIARSHGWTLVPSGNTALNLLGLSTQVPARWEYFSDGPAKTYAWDGGTLVFQRRAIRETSALSPKTALVVQALKALGRERVDESVIEQLRQHLDETELRQAIRETRYASAWVHEALRTLTLEKEVDHA
jgi:Family of unknown function (DUF6088)